LISNHNLKTENIRMKFLKLDVQLRYYWSI